MEVSQFGGVKTAADGIEIRNPAFDVTPHRYVDAIITEVGIVRAPLRVKPLRRRSSCRGIKCRCHKMNNHPRLAIIGGSGLYSMEGLSDVQEVEISTPFGSHK